MPATYSAYPVIEVTPFDGWSNPIFNTSDGGLRLSAAPQNGALLDALMITYYHSLLTVVKQLSCYLSCAAYPTITRFALATCRQTCQLSFL